MILPVDPGVDTSGDAPVVSRDEPRTANERARVLAGLPARVEPTPRRVRDQRRRREIAQLNIECEVWQKSAIIAAAEQAGMTLKDYILDRVLGPVEHSF